MLASILTILEAHNVSTEGISRCDVCVRRKWRRDIMTRIPAVVFVGGALQHDEEDVERAMFGPWRSRVGFGTNLLHIAYSSTSNR